MQAFQHGFIQGLNEYQKLALIHTTDQEFPSIESF